ncbi:Phospholipase A2-like domain [Popillia japonica]|uniref:Phospholipase A2-like domain n=1 Tax=Popillia japonica TaxID=7064 RepID=A0AAW1JHA8_POPJA
MPQLPYHKYFGPGNELSGDDPVDTDDAIALEHDSAYETALSAEDILKADENAILDFWDDFNFWDDFSTSGNWHSLVGAAGLTLKHQVEKQVGVLYPDMASKHRYKALTFTNRRDEHEERQRSNPIDGTNMKNANEVIVKDNNNDIGQDETNSPMATDAVDAPQSESSIGNHNGVTNPGGNTAPLYFNTSLASPSMTFFKKSRLMHTWGFASSKFPRGAKNRVNDYIAYSTSLAYLPVDWVPFYLSPVEYNNLPIGSYIKEVYVEVIPKGVRCSFDVGTTLKI